MEKPRVKYSTFAAQKLATQREGTIAWLIEKFILEMDQPGGRSLGLSRRYTLKLLQRSRIGAVQYAALTPPDIIEHCKTRKAAGILPQTINQDATYLSGVLKHAVDVWDMDDEVLETYKRAKRQLIRQQLIAKAQARDRRPTQDELDRLLALAAEDDKRPKNKIPMVAIIKFSYLSARRISETCRLRWSDLDHEKKLCLVRDLKNPKGKGFHAWFPLIGEEWDLVMAQPRYPGEDRIFPYNPKSCGARYVKMKHKLGIKNLRLHDNRREAISRLFEQGFNVPEVALKSLHRNPTQLLGTYTRLKPESLHAGPAAKRAQA